MLPAKDVDLSRVQPKIIRTRVDELPTKRFRPDGGAAKSVPCLLAGAGNSSAAAPASSSTPTQPAGNLDSASSAADKKTLKICLHSVIPYELLRRFDRVARKLCATAGSDPANRALVESVETTLQVLYVAGGARATNLLQLSDRVAGGAGEFVVLRHTVRWPDDEDEAEVGDEKCLAWLPGNTFAGPIPDLRCDQPGPLEFEAGCVGSIGVPRYRLLASLHRKLVRFVLKTPECEQTLSRVNKLLVKMKPVLCHGIEIDYTQLAKELQCP